MRFYSQPHQFYCGIDLHARTLYLCVLDHAGITRLHKEIPAEPAALLEALASFRDGLVIATECMFAWYWLADLCADQGIPFVLGHALAMKAIHGGKAKNDKIDAHKIAVLLRGGMLPQAYVYPKGMRETRDLLRRRMFLVHKRARNRPGRWSPKPNWGAIGRARRRGDFSLGTMIPRGPRCATVPDPVAWIGPPPGDRFA